MPHGHRKRGRQRTHENKTKEGDDVDNWIQVQPEKMEAVGQNRAEWRRDICGLFSNFGLFSDGEYNASATQVISVL